MARGHPDYYPSVGRTAEGEPLPIYSKPPVWFEDQMEGPENRWHAINGTTEILTEYAGPIVTHRPYTLSGMLLITSEVGGPGFALAMAGTVPLTTNIGIACTFCVVENDYYDNAANSCRIIYGDFYTGTYHHQFSIGYNPRTGDWYVGGVLLTNFPVNELYWHYIKLIINPLKQEYVRLQINNNVIDMRGTGYAYALSGLDSCYHLNIDITSAPLLTAYLLIDTYIVTIGET